MRYIHILSLIDFLSQLSKIVYTFLKHKHTQTYKDDYTKSQMVIHHNIWYKSCVRINACNTSLNKCPSLQLDVVAIEKGAFRSPSTTVTNLLTVANFQNNGKILILCVDKALISDGEKFCSSKAMYC